MIAVEGQELESLNNICFVTEQFDSGEDYAKKIIQYVAQNYTIILKVPLNILIGLFISFYVLFTKEKLGAQFKKLSAALLSKETNEALLARVSKSNATFGGYFTGVVLDAIFIGLMSFILLLIFGIPYASLIATVLAITNIIPIFALKGVSGFFQRITRLILSPICAVL